VRSLAILFLAAVLAGCSGSGSRSGDNHSSLSPGGDARQRAKIRTELAASYFVEGNHAVALDELATAINADSSYAPAYSVRGLVRMRLGENAEAEADFRKALELGPNDPEINNNYGWFLCQTGKEKESFAYFAQAIKNPLYQTPEKSWVNSGLCAMRIQDFKRAEDHLHRAHRPGKAGNIALYPLALLDYERGAYSQARGWLAEFHRVQESTAESLWLALRVERRLGDRSAEASYSSQLRRRFPDSKETRELRLGNYE
jgi:type IV pilus assembly protein PilF